MREDPLLQKLARGGFAALVIKVGAAGLSFLMFLFLARAMSAEDFGRFGFAFSLATLLSVLGSFGMRMLVLRFAAVYDDQDQRALLNGVVRTGYIAVFAGCGALGLGVAVFGAFWPGLEARGYLIAAGVFTLVLGLAEYQAHVLRALGGMTLALLPRDILWRAGVIFIAAAASFGLLPMLGAGGGMWLTVSVLAGALLGQALAHPATRPKRLLTEPAETKLPEWRHAALGLWGTSFVQAAAPNLAVVIVGVVLSPEETGSFFAALRVAMLMNLFLMASNMAAIPTMSKFYHRGDLARVQRTAATVAFVATVASLIGFALFVLLGQQLLGLFRLSDPESAKSLLLILAVGFVMNTACGPNFALMEVSGRQGVLLRWNVPLQTCGLLAMMIAGALYGPNGVAVAFASTMAVSNLTIWALCRTLLHVNTLPVGLIEAIRKPNGQT